MSTARTIGLVVMLLALGVAYLAGSRAGSLRTTLFLLAVLLYAIAVLFIMAEPVS